jgi:hypothetical protein
VKRLTIFAKGNVDVRDSLHSCTVGGKIVWNGINEVLRTHNKGALARVRHETLTRTDALLSARGEFPPQLASHGLPLGSYPLSSQFSNAMFTCACDVAVLSIQPDVTTALVRHRRDGYLMFPWDQHRWSNDQRAWVKQEYERLELLDVGQSMTNFARIIERIRQTSSVPILIYNMSTVVPGESLHCYEGMEAALSTRIRDFNLALIRLSERTGISIVDVDALLARAGADRLKIDALHLTAEGYRLVATQVARIMEDLGVFAEGEIAACTSA